MGFAYTVLHWSPQQFWESTPYEMNAATEMFLAIHGDDKSKSEADFAEFMKSLEQSGVA